MDEKPQHEEIQRSLGRIEGGLTALTKSVDKRSESVDKILEIHKKDIDKLKAGQTTLKAQAGIIASVAGVVIIAGWEFIKNKFTQGG